MSEDTTKLILPYLLEGQGSPEQTHNDALNVLDAVVQLAVLGFKVVAPGELVTNGDVYLVADSAVTEADWIGHEGELAFYYNGWYFRTPREGWTLWDSVEDIYYILNDSGWVCLGCLYGLTFNYEFDDTTAKADPGAGKFRLNSADLSLATAMYIDDLDKLGTDLSTIFALIFHQRIAIKNKTASGLLIYDVGESTDETGYFTFTLSFVAEVGTPEVLADGDKVNILSSFVAQKSTLIFSVSGTLTTGDDKTPWVIIPRNLKCFKAYVWVKTAPTGQAITIEIEKSANGTGWSTVVASSALQIAATDRKGSTTTIATPNLVEGDVLRLNIDQVGSGLAGADLTVLLLGL